MSRRTVIFGYGPAGRTIASRLAAAGDHIRIAQRSKPAAMATRLEFFPCDVLHDAEVVAATAGADRIVIATGFAYDMKVWAENWPRAMTNFLDAAATTGAPTLFLDNMYMYGPQSALIRETTSFTAWGGKPAVRRAISEMWRSASDQGRVRMCALRVPDFYGPGVTNSHLGQLLFGRLAAGKPALFAVPVDHPHDVAYLPDVARAVETLLEAPESACGEVWHMPCAATRTLREIVEIAAAAMGKKARVRSIPAFIQTLMRFASPMLREVHDVRFLFDRPYHVDAMKFSTRFWSDVTPIEVGVAQTARCFLRPAA